jgi:hypothetical protein
VVGKEYKGDGIYQAACRLNRGLGLLRPQHYMSDEHNRWAVWVLRAVHTDGIRGATEFLGCIQAWCKQCGFSVEFVVMNVNGRT